MAEQPAKVALGLNSLNPSSIISLNATIVSSMTGNKLFTTPAVPLADMSTDAQDYQTEENEINAAEAQLKARRTANKGRLKKVEKNMTQQANYVNGIAQGSRSIIESAGMPASSEAQAKGKLPVVTGLQLSPGGARGQVDAKWGAVSKKKGSRDGYMVYFGPSPTNMTGKEFAHGSSFTIKDQPSGQDLWVCVQVLGKESGDCCNPMSQMVP
ncbi:hypothetical protein Q5H93_02125 [Hymenobacter sp. ASUV-10]|uniref:Uncharacterized protein n=1 Tax=Hymenobacter aranciens TaxID=3063996 RepID=A0ABT9B5T5_9BACT|nr:hypothetical protein [Hymenobacter sp. ASUV-10]MDO7873512.1 hypothetical protein [Hymenobacter sp. ASUV-10]